MIDNQANALASIMKDEDIQKYAGEGFWNLVQAVLTKDFFSGMGSDPKRKGTYFSYANCSLLGKNEEISFRYIP